MVNNTYRLTTICGQRASGELQHLVDLLLPQSLLFSLLPPAISSQLYTIFFNKKLLKYKKELHKAIKLS